jgi:preprotein translocase subunit SecD
VIDAALAEPAMRAAAAVKPVSKVLVVVFMIARYLLF